MVKERTVKDQYIKVQRKTGWYSTHGENGIVQDQYSMEKRTTIRHGTTHTVKIGYDRISTTRKRERHECTVQ